MQHKEPQEGESDHSRQVVAFVVLLFFAVSDRLLKQWASTLPIQETAESARSLFGVEYYQNSHAVFGLPIPDLFLNPLILLASVFLAFYALRLFYQKSFWSGLSVLLIVFGGTSNAVDRLTSGFVVDMFRVGASVFNLADVMIFTGFIFVAAKMMTQRSFRLFSS